MKKLIFLDTEATGNEVDHDRLCQVCYKCGDMVRTEYFKPPLPISVKAMSVTHITNKVVESKPSFINSPMYQELEVLLKEGVLIAHNVKFDIAMLKAEGLTVPTFICTLRIARYLDQDNKIPEYNLQFLRYFLDLEVEGSAHDAEGDVMVLYSLFNRLLVKMVEKIGNEEGAIMEMIEISKKPVIFKQFNFGKYKGQNVEDVYHKDVGYLEWLLKTKLADGGDDEDWIYTLRHFLG
jgi:exodeoxyribonuclease X